MATRFGQRKTPQDHQLSRLDKADAIFEGLKQRIANQIESINRLLKDGSYDKEMEWLHKELADKERKLAHIKVLLGDNMPMTPDLKARLVAILEEEAPNV